MKIIFNALAFCADSVQRKWDELKSFLTEEDY